MDNPHVLLSTSEGDILLELLADQAPASVANFLAYVEAGHYDETLFHRVVRGFVIQGGGFGRNLEPRPTRDPVENEAANGPGNLAGTVAMARTQDPHSATSQFFINAADNPGLDHRGETPEEFGYAVFGRVVEGMDVVRKINWKVTKPRPGFPDLPDEPVVLVSAQRFE
jgi:peptidyl-prolyl cis-trans isomerase B (cyclophilin B)